MTGVTDSRAIRFKVYRNGDSHFTGKTIVLDRAKIRQWEPLLMDVTTRVGSAEFVRNIRTPTHGTKIETLDQLQQGQEYVAVGNGGFKRLGYLDLEATAIPRMNPRPRNLNVTPVTHSSIRCPGRISSVPMEVVFINVYANGLQFDPPDRFKLKMWMLQDWRVVMNLISDTVGLRIGAITKLYTLNGKLVTSAENMKSGDEYVAVGRQFPIFRQLQYGSHI